MKKPSRFYFARGLVLAGAIVMMLSLGCKSGEPSGGSDGTCSGGSVEMTQINSGHSCSAFEMPTVTMKALTLPCLEKNASPVVTCSGSPNQWQNCKFIAFEFKELSLLSPITFEGEFKCGSDPAMVATFDPNQIPGKASPDTLPLIEVDFVVP